MKSAGKWHRSSMAISRIPVRRVQSAALIRILVLMRGAKEKAFRQRR